jgi:hypothetical protein
LRCRAAATAADAATAVALPPSRCAPLPDIALLPPPLTLPLWPRHCQAAADVALLRCRHRHSLRAAATVLPPLRCAPPPRFPLLPPPLTLPPPPRSRHAAANVALALVDCYISANSDAFLSPHPTPFLSIHTQMTPYCACHTNHDKTLCGVVRCAHQPHGLCLDQAHALSPMVCG